MKSNTFFVLMIISCITLAGCTTQNSNNHEEVNSVKDNSLYQVVEKKDNDDSKLQYSEAKSIVIVETGGEDGRDLVWQISENDGKYYISVDNMKYDRHIMQEITEDEYKSVTCIDFNEYFENNLRDNTVIMDNVYHHTKIDFVNDGTFESDDYYMTRIIQMMYDIASKYDTCDFSNFYY